MYVHGTPASSSPSSCSSQVLGFQINKKRVVMLLHAKFSVPTYGFTQCIVLLLCRSIYIPDAASYVGGCV